MAQWDFAADMEDLLERVEHGHGPRSMSQMVAAAQEVVSATDAADLQRWLIDHAETLVGQQILVTSVHAQAAPSSEITRKLHALLAVAAPPTAGAAVEWLKEEHPALLRAWLLSRVEDLLDAELRDLHSPGQ